MFLQTLITILVWVAVLCSTGVVSDRISKSEKLQIANKLNTLVRYSGWQSMNDVKILKTKRGEIKDPMSEILEAMSLNQKPVDESNVVRRHKEIWTVLMCRYGEIIYHYKMFIRNLIQVCLYEKKSSLSRQRYYDCFDLLLVKLLSMSPRFKCMVDASVYIFSLNPTSKLKHSMVEATEKLAEYTLTLRQTILSRLPEDGTKADAVDVEINAIDKHFKEVYLRNVKSFNLDHCNVPRKKIWIAQNLITDFLHAKINQRIPQETSMLKYAEHQIDGYVEETFICWFYNLGFGYDEEGNVEIRNN